MEWTTGYHGVRGSHGSGMFANKSRTIHARFSLEEFGRQTVSRCLPKRVAGLRRNRNPRPPAVIPQKERRPAPPLQSAGRPQPKISLERNYARSAILQMTHTFFIFPLRISVAPVPTRRAPPHTPSVAVRRTCSKSLAIPPSDPSLERLCFPNP